MLDRLFNGDIRRHGVVEHYECGCCVSRDQCLHLMSTVALKCLYRAHMRILSRSHWTGATEAVGDFLPLLLHGVFAAAYLRALSTEDHVAAAMHFVDVVGFDRNIGDQSTGVSEGPREDAPRERIDGVVAAMERPSISVWREEASARVRSTREWLLSGVAADDVVHFALHLQPAAKLLLNQLAKLRV